MLNTLREARTTLRTVGAVLLGGLAWFGMAQTARAFQLGSEDWQLHGFLSQGYLYTSGNRVFGNSRNLGSLDFTELGVNASVRVLPNLLISAQGLYRSTGVSDPQGLRLDFAQVDYHRSFLRDAVTVGLRGGRVKVPVGLYNATRDVVWTRPSVLLPQSVYLDTLGLRQAMLSADGGLGYGRYNYGDHQFSVEFMYAEPQVQSDNVKLFLVGDANVPGRLNGRPIGVGRAAYEWMGGRVRLMYTAVDVNRHFNSSSPDFPSGQVAALYQLISAQYNAERWSLTAEYNWIDARREGFVPVPMDGTSESYYVQGEYRISDRWTAVARYDVFHTSRDDSSGRHQSALYGLPRHGFYANDLTLGARWEFVRNWLIAAEYHNVQGTAWLSPLDNPDLNRGGGDPRWDMVTMMVSFRF